MSSDELRALAEDIKKNGQRLPCSIVERRGKFVLIDGRNRLDALELLGDDERLNLDNSIVFEELSNDTDIYAYVISANIHRRHLTAEQKRDLIAKLIKATPEKSNRQIAKTAKVDDKTVGAVRAELEATAEIPQLEKTVGKDGKARKRPAKKKATKPEAEDSGNAIGPEASAEAMKAKFAALDDDGDDHTKQPPRAEVAKLVRAWVQASPEARRQFIRERWDEIACARKQLDANGAADEDRWIEGDTL
jgi:ParB-like chromosome segregation protein Spo0J